MRLLGRTALLVFAFLALTSSAALADERILDFNSLIRIHVDGSLTVTETIKVRSEARTIKRGIVREIPTTYTDRTGRRVVVRLDVMEVKRDGKPEPYHTESASNGLKIYMGQKSVFLRPGVYTYTLSYRTDRQIGFFAKFDELYWNVTGNDWRLPIDRARAVIELPAGAELVQHAAYTGPMGAAGRDFTFSTDNQGNPVFTTTRILGLREGLTVAVAWPKGVVAEPTGWQKALYLVGDYPGAAGSGLGFVVVLLFYLIMWWRVGRDLPPGAIVPLFNPPHGISPAAARYVTRMGFDHTCFAAAVVSMAVKGNILIKEGRKYYTLTRIKSGTEGLSTGEAKAMDKLFTKGDAITLKNTNHNKIKRAIKALEAYLRSDYEKTYFVANRMWFVVGLGLTVLALVAMALTSVDILGTLFMSLWLMVWTIGCSFLVWRWWWAKGFGAKLGMGLFTLPFVGGWFAGFFMLGQTASYPAVGLFIITCLLNPLFAWLLKAPTGVGRTLLDQLEGFKMYLTAAEKDRMEVLNPPDKTPELFEKYLPYALALGVEQKWSEQFSDVLEFAGQGGGQHVPAWYVGSSWSRLGAGAFAADLSSSMSGAISSSSTAPGSSSGSGGGGSSGGGGGGGGGGGW